MKKIMFSDEFMLTKAVLDGRKTQTRRLLTLTLHKKAGGVKLIDVSPSKVFLEGGKWKFIYDDYVFLLPKNNYPKYNVGEVVAVAQSYCDCGNLPDYELDEDGYPIMPTRSGFFNKMFVRADLMPHQIRITNVRTERLQEISEEDCLKEGIGKYYIGFGTDIVDDMGFTYSFDAQGKRGFPNAREAYASLIDSISGKGTWENNPYVFVYDFELVK